MKINFYKYQGTGNDFVMIDNRDAAFPKNDTSAIMWLCDRRFGIGADGLILLENDKNADFRMVYYNSDGNESSMCGNGGRCIVAFANRLGLIEDRASFIATDGPHSAEIAPDSEISLGMKDVTSVERYDSYYFLNTGSPHHVEPVKDIKNFPVQETGAAIRYSDLYGTSGSNVNFVEQEETDIFAVRTYERGVEDETLSCGTGVTAVAIAMHAAGKVSSESVTLLTPGGKLQVTFNEDSGKYTDVILKGPAEFVFEGTIELP
ncbi:MAG TPA: diaminopimelate epimerase [Flavobacterium sp.]|jgi:diaminopimelate epimerase